MEHAERTEPRTRLGRVIMQSTIKTTLNEGDILIQWTGGDLPESESRAPLSAEERMTYVQVTELLNDDLIVEMAPGAWSLGYDDVDKLSSEQFDLLHLPKPEPLGSAVYTKKGTSGRFKRLGLDLRSTEHGILNNAARRGPFLQIGETKFILPEKAVRDLEAQLLAGPDTAHYESEVAAQQAYHAKAKQLAKVAGATVEPWLEREDYEFPEAIGVSLNGDLDRGLEVSPSARGVYDPELQELLGKSQGRRGVVWKGTGRERRRVVLEPRQRAVLQELERRGRHIAPENVPAFLDTPEAFLPPDVDLSDFSERVKGLKIKVYDSRPYLHIRQGKLNWFPEVSIDVEPRDHPAAGDGDQMSKPPKIGDDEYIKKAKEALSKGQTYFRHGDGIVHFDPNALGPLTRLEEIAGEGGIKGIAGSKKYILDIFENIEALEYSVESEDTDEEPEEKKREILEFPIPETLQATLRPFQVTGYHWIRTLDQRKRGGLLADDMGLGKTLQVISFLAAMREEDRVSPSLAVLPKTLIQNWFDEIKRFCPDLKVAHYSGGHVPDASLFAGIDLVLTTYDTLRINQVDLARIDWNVVVCDEAQAIKNPTTGRTTAVKGLKSNMRIAMTGTPVENGLSELWSIMDWVQPGLLRSRLDFRAAHERPIIDATDEESRRGHVRSLQEKIIDHYLRRMKTEVLDGLPGKTIHRLEKPLSPTQLARYMTAVESARNAGRGAMLACLQELLRLSACPWTEDEAYGITGTPEEITLCPKLGAMLEKLDVIRDRQEKALIFVERLAVQGMLQNVLFHRYGIRADLINGRITSGRQAIVDRFNGLQGFQVMLLSPKVGGTGLNITSANHVFHYMRPWNPAIENQATDRVHRIGQVKDVHVYLPIATWPDGTSESVEQVLDELIKTKTALATDVIVPTARMSLDRDVMDQIFKTE